MMILVIWSETGLLPLMDLRPRIPPDLTPIGTLDGTQSETISRWVISRSGPFQRYPGSGPNLDPILDRIRTRSGPDLDQSRSEIGWN